MKSFEPRLYYGLPSDGSADYVGTDGDGMNNWQEWIAGTNPTNPLSVPRMQPLTNTVSSVLVSWQSVANRTYTVERATALGAPAAFSAVATNLSGQNGLTTYSNTSPGQGSYFYRIGVQR
jgi:hypothetical protein